MPVFLDTPAACTIASVPTVDPATGQLMIVQDICRNAADQGFVNVSASGKPSSTVLAFGAVQPTYDPPRWAVDGSLFVYAAGTPGATSLYAFVLEKKQVVPLVGGSAQKNVRSGTIAPDGSAIVYCVDEGRGDNLHVLDLTKEPAVDRAITNDGVSCDPLF